jgi:flagellin
MGSFSILNNISGLAARNDLSTNNVHLAQALLRLSSGKRMNSGADDAAGLQIADTLRGNVYALNQAVRNASDAVAVAQLADGALAEIGNLLIRAVTLAQESASQTVDSTGRASLHGEYLEIQGEIARIAEHTNFNGVKIFSTSGFNGNLSVFVGDISSVSSISVAISTITTSGRTVSDIRNQNLATVDLTTPGSAATSVTTIRNGLRGAAAMRADIGAGINRLQSAISVLQSQSLNTQAAESVIRDANLAEETARLARYQLLAASGIAALAQANLGSSLVLGLLNSTASTPYEFAAGSEQSKATWSLTNQSPFSLPFPSSDDDKSR